MRSARCATVAHELGEAYDAPVRGSAAIVEDGSAYDVPRVVSRGESKVRSGCCGVNPPERPDRAFLRGSTATPGGSG